MKVEKSVQAFNLAARVELLKKIEPFNYLPRETLYKIASLVNEEKYPAGAYLVRQNEPSKRVLFLVIEGKVEISVTDNTGKETVTGYRQVYDFLGETVFLSDETYPGSARAVEDTRCLLLPQEVFEDLIEESPTFAVFFTRLLADRLRILYQKFSFYDEEDTTGDEALSKHIADIMVTKVVTCNPEDDLKKIAGIMHKNNVSSVIVVHQEKPLGIITEGDLVARIARGEDLEKTAGLKARDIMSSGLISVKPQDFSYQAFLLMVKHRIKHVAVIEDDKLAGIVALRDIIKSRKTGSLGIVNRIESCSTIEEIAALRPEIDQVLQALLLERATVSEINALITEFYDRITRRVIEISEKDMIEEGYGPPPVSYCWITMGSSGRKEQYARTDQDNGIIYEDITDERKKEQVNNYFLLLGEKVVSGLELFGFKRCKGNVMANNEKWCRSFQSWRTVIRNWIDVLEPLNVRLMTIFLDFRYLYGKKSLYDLLRNFVVRNFRDNLVVLSFLVEDNLNKKVPLNIFRQIQTEKTGEYRNQLNLKSSACVHVVDCMRVFALREGILATNTFERIKEIGKRNVLSQKDVEFITAAYETLMMFRIRDAITKMRKGKQPDNYVNPQELSNREYALLREALIIVSRLQSLTRQKFYYYIP